MPASQIALLSSKATNNVAGSAWAADGVASVMDGTLDMRELPGFGIMDSRTYRVGPSVAS